MEEASSIDILTPMLEIYLETIFFYLMYTLDLFFLSEHPFIFYPKYFVVLFMDMY